MRKLLAVIVCALATGPLLAAGQTGWTLIGWNDLGMHCTDGTDYAVFGVLPPFNTFHAQLIGPAAGLVESPAGLTLTYEAVADPGGSVNRTSVGKTNFWQYVHPLFGVSPAPDVGLAGYGMPGSANLPQTMGFDQSRKWFSGEGVPITPYDDGGKKNYYPMMRLTARDGSGAVLASTDIVLPVSDEMDCRTCHAPGSSEAAKPADGWVTTGDLIRDVKLNILKIHDQHQQGNINYVTALAAAGYRPEGLYVTAAGYTSPVLCARCHASNALPGTGMAPMQPLTEAVHARHSDAVDPVELVPLGSIDNRSSCYRCHPGAETKCLRGVMGNSIAQDGTPAIQCQSCHGGMSDVGRQGRAGWLEEPNCQACHTGTAITNSGQIRYTSVFASPGIMRVPADTTFATSPDQPAPGLSLYRFSTGHGGLYCEACHGSTHAELPASHQNDNVQAIAIQGHAGTLSDCGACHATVPSTVTGGPHGMHPVGQAWVSGHEQAAESNRSQCTVCHGSDYRGTVLSRALGDRSITSGFGSRFYWRGFQVSCYSCHNGPNSESSTSNAAPVVNDVSATTPGGVPVTIALPASDANRDPLTLRIVSQPPHGRVGLSATESVYYPDPGFSGADVFTFAAWDGSTNSNLGRATVNVAAVASYALSVFRSGAGTGNVSSSPPGIACGNTCSASYASGTVVTLTAVPAAGSSFSGWSGACSGTGACSVTMTQAQSVTATFAAAPTVYQLTVTKGGNGTGTVTSSPPGINCGNACTAPFTAGITLTLTATPAAGSVFGGWSGGPCSGVGTCVVSMTQAQSVTATFKKGAKRHAAVFGTTWQ